MSEAELWAHIRELEKEVAVLKREHALENKRLSDALERLAEGFGSLSKTVNRAFGGVVVLHIVVLPLVLFYVKHAAA